MSLNRNKYSSNKENQEFDLDEYIAENSRMGNADAAPEKSTQNKSSFLKNAALLSIFAFLVFLGSNEWSFKEAFGFGEAKQNQVIVLNTDIPEPIVEVPASTAEQPRLITIDENKLASELESLEELESINTIVEANLADALKELENLENLSELSSLSELSELSELGNLAELSALSELAKLGDLEGITGLNIGDGFNIVILPPFEEYVSSVKAISGFSDADIQKLYNANIPLKSVEQIIKESGNESLDADNIIEKFKLDQ